MRRRSSAAVRRADDAQQDDERRRVERRHVARRQGRRREQLTLGLGEAPVAHEEARAAAPTNAGGGFDVIVTQVGMKGWMGTITNAIQNGNGGSRG